MSIASDRARKVRDYALVRHAAHGGEPSATEIAAALDLSVAQVELVL